MLELYLGGARSGKSKLAEDQAKLQAKHDQKHLIYLATATAGDEEMKARIQLHQHRRSVEHGFFWQTVEEPFALADKLIELNHENNCVLVDCLTLWLSNLLLDPSPEKLAHERQKLLSSLPMMKCNIIFVSNEVGQGIVPVNKLSRQFVDESGSLHQEIAALCHRVVFTVAGLPQLLKGEPLDMALLD